MHFNTHKLKNLNPTKRRWTPLVKQNRIIKQKKTKWSSMQTFLKYGPQLAKSNFFANQLVLYTIDRPFIKSQEAFNYKHQAVQDLKKFYNFLKDKRLRTLLKQTDTVYRANIRRSSPKRQKILAKRTSLVRALESELQVALYRSLLVPRINSARQIVRHGKVYVNGVQCRQPSHILKSGDFVELKLSHLIAADSIKTWTNIPFRTPPIHLEVRIKTNRFVFIEKPHTSEVRFPFILDLRRVRNFYK